MQEKLVNILISVLNEVRRSNKPPGDIDRSALLQEGYTDSEISSAVTWLRDRMHAEQSGASFPAALAPGSFRILHSAEQHVITPEAYGTLIQLRELNVISPAELELVIERAMASGLDRLTHEEIHAIVEAVLFETDASGMHGHRSASSPDGTVH